ncbi:MAG: hypothetical protein ABIJ92_04330 [Candidatus Aenigmatarchaeota archaeon]
METRVVLWLLVTTAVIWVPIGLIIWHNIRQPTRFIAYHEKMQNRQNLIDMIIHELVMEDWWEEDKNDPVGDIFTMLLFEVGVLAVGAIISAIASVFLYDGWMAFWIWTVVSGFVLNNIIFTGMYQADETKYQTMHVSISSLCLIDLPPYKRTELRDRSLMYLLEPLQI